MFLSLFWKILSPLGLWSHSPSVDARDASSSRDSHQRSLLEDRIFPRVKMSVANHSDLPLLLRTSYKSFQNQFLRREPFTSYNFCLTNICMKTVDYQSTLQTCVHHGDKSCQGVQQQSSSLSPLGLKNCWVLMSWWVYKCFARKPKSTVDSECNARWKETNKFLGVNEDKLIWTSVSIT